MRRGPRRSARAGAGGLVAVVAAIALALAAGSSRAADPRRVLFIFPTQPAVVAVQAAEAGLRDELRARGADHVEVFSEHLDSARFPDPAHRARFAAYLADKYADARPDLLIAGADPSLALVLEHRATLFPGVPVIFTAIAAGNPRLAQLPADFVGLVSRLDAGPTIDLALRLLPRSRRVVVVGGAAPVDRGWQVAAAASLKAYEGRLEVAWVAGLPMADTLRELARVPRDSIVLLLPTNRDGAGEYLIAERAAEVEIAVSAAPAFSPYTTALGLGVVGGHGDSFESIGRETATLALRVLAGERPAMPVERPAGAAVSRVDWRQLRRWGIDESRLPEDAVVLFREPSLWEAHRLEAIATLVVVLAQAAMITGLVVQRGRRRRAEARTRLAERRAEEQRRELTHLSRVATLGELSGAIAHELNQPLTAILSNAQAGLRMMKRPAPDLVEIQAILADIATEDQRAGDVIRHLRMLLRKDDARMDALDLNAIVTGTIQLLNSELVARGVRVATDLARDLPPVIGDRIQLQQVLLNLIGNACDAMERRAPGERRISVTTAAAADGPVRLAVSDEGEGIADAVVTRLFQPFVTSKPKGLGLGLSICRSIVEAHGGTLAGVNKTGGGATFSVALPARAGAAP